MKADHYISLCCEQAAQSPLHFRHGAIIVRGGKVIDQGYNDYRRGFDGGIVNKSRASSSLALAKPEHKSKSKMKSKFDEMSSCGEQNLALDNHPLLVDHMTMADHKKNTPFSMHAEMMAIHSAFSQSTVAASRTMWSVKPSFKEPGGSQQYESQSYEGQQV